MPPTTTFTPAQSQAIETLGLSAALISVVAGIVTFYWFIRMERLFRHRLIMLQIQCDMFRSLWYFLHPVVVLIHGPVEDASLFCQISGFSISLATEASDFAVLAIAIHAALYVFSPPKHVSEGGSYPYRRLLYALWFMVPTILASLAFVNPRGGYVSHGSDCGLPVRPIWYRVALSWMPRYIILGAIVIIYLAIYTYVRYNFKSVEMDLQHTFLRDEDGHAAAAQSRPARGLDGEDSANPANRLAIPKLRRHGLTASGSRSSSGSYDWIPSEVIIKPGSCLAKSRITFEDPSRPTPLLQAQHSDPTPPERLHFTVEQRQSLPGSISNSTADGAGDSESVIGIMDALQESRISAREAFEIAQRRSRRKLSNIRTGLVGNEHLRKTHQNIRRQLRLLFIYPLVYLLMWLIPFVLHCLQYSDHYVQHPPFVLSCLAALMLSLQCAVNCVVFSTREKPWQSIPCADGTFLGSFNFWKCKRRDGFSLSEDHPEFEHAHPDVCPHRHRFQTCRGPGKSRAVMAHDFRNARDRRRREIVENLRIRDLQRGFAPESGSSTPPPPPPRQTGHGGDAAAFDSLGDAAGGGGGGSSSAARRQERHWWDGEEQCLDEARTRPTHAKTSRFRKLSLWQRTGLQEREDIDMDDDDGARVEADDEDEDEDDDDDAAEPTNRGAVVVVEDQG